jgi:hypothetical protein
MVGTAGTTSRYEAMSEFDLDREIEELERVLEELGPVKHDTLARGVGAVAWGPRRFDSALREEVAEGRVTRRGRTYARNGNGATRGSPH